MSKNILENARKGKATNAVRLALESEHITLEDALQKIAAGHAVVPSNNIRNVAKPCLIGGGSRIKVNANIGSSMDHESMVEELDKLKMAVANGAETTPMYLPNSK